MKTLEEFREAVSKRRLTYADKLYHVWVEQLFTERDVAIADRDLWHRRCNERFRENLNLNDEIERLKAELAQRRDMTLTAELKNAISRLRRWHDLTKPARENTDVLLLCETIERWSREGAKVEPWCACKYGEHSNGNNDCPRNHQAPPAPDLASLRETIEESLVSFVYGVIARRANEQTDDDTASEVLGGLLAYIVAVIDARQVKL